MNYTKTIVSAIIVGIVAIALGYIIGWVTKPYLGADLPEACSAWNKNYMMEINLFLIGAFAYLILKLTKVANMFDDDLDRFLE